MSADKKKNELKFQISRKTKLRSKETFWTNSLIWQSMSEMSFSGKICIFAPNKSNLNIKYASNYDPPIYKVLIDHVYRMVSPMSYHYNQLSFLRCSWRHPRKSNVPENSFFVQIDS
uniref:Uncharacterized protein n=1 Tax=Onchocerca volvulus TaxID=6282 RepID=A0A8R1TK77_ONCVO